MESNYKLLLENGNYLLLEDDGEILLEQQILILYLQETIGLNIALNNSINKRLFEKFILTPNLIINRLLFKLVSENIKVIDNKIFSISVIKNEMLYITDSINISINKKIYEIIDIFSVVKNDINKKIVEIFRLNDSILLIGIFKKELSEILGLNIFIVRNLIKTLSENIKLTDILNITISRLINFIEKLKIKGIIFKIGEKNLNELIKLKDGSFKIVVRNLIEELGLNDIFGSTKSAGLYLIEKIKIKDIFGKALSKILIEILSIKDIIIKSNVRVLNEVLFIKDFINASRVYVRNLFERLNLTIYFDKSVSKRLKEYIHTVGRFSAVKSAVLGLIERLILKDIVDDALAKVFKETLNIKDSSNRLIEKLFGESVSLKEIRIINIIKNFITKIGVRDTFNTISVFLKNIFENIGFKDNLNIVKIFIRKFIETAGLLDKFFTDRIKAVRAIIVKISSLAYGVGIKKIKSNFNIKSMKKNISVKSKKKL